MLKIERNLVLAGVIAVTLCLAGCGNRAPANVVVDTSAATDAAPAASASPEKPAAAPVATTPAYTAPVVTGSLVVSNVSKTRTGIVLFKKMHVSGSVINSSNVPLSGTLKVQFQKNKGIFTKTLTATGVKTVVVSTLQPGQSFPVTVDSDTRNDDAEVTVESNPTTSTAPAAAALPAGRRR